MHWLSLLVTLTFASFSFAYPNPIAIYGNTAADDPMLCKDGSGTYFLYSTGPGIEVRTSTDRITWTYAGVVWPDGASWTDPFTNTTNGSLWAPDSLLRGINFRVSKRKSAIFFAKSSTGLPGSFTNEGLVVSTADGDSYNAIDPNLLIGEFKFNLVFLDRLSICHEDGSTWYLSFGSFWTGIKGVPVKPNTGNTTTSTLDSLAQRNGSQAVEASVIYKYGDYYYLFTSWDKCCEGASSTYNVRVGRSKSRSGGFVDADGVALTDGGGTLILASHDGVFGPGGQDLLADSDGIVMVYHYFTSAGTIQYLGINHLDFSNGWPVVV
ncbi:hypothetical protein EW145_g5700 [Phellinidium pouzarii]|uniref:Endo-1,5-alpha-L-arabinanase A n=1 Tax=Phellinidium pouzarii TaxID=167371 RepID=A0A4S4L0E8_9AGAM|nr:hypothetical protein EW145_g5700 [Phellinidium pouzarii]